MKATLGEDQREHCKEAALRLSSGFLWQETKEGWRHWNEIYCRLNTMSEHGTLDGKPADPEEPEEPPTLYRTPTKDDVGRTIDVKADDGTHLLNFTLLAVIDEEYGFIANKPGEYPVPIGFREARISITEDDQWEKLAREQFDQLPPEGRTPTHLDVGRAGFALVQKCEDRPPKWYRCYIESFLRNCGEMNDDMFFVNLRGVDHIASGKFWVARCNIRVPFPEDA